LTAVYFSKVSVVGLGANMLVIPAAGASVILGMITAMTGWFSLWLAGIYGALNQLVLAVALLVTQYAGNLPFAFVDTSRFFPIYTLPFYIAIVMLFSLHNRVLTKHLLISFLAALNLAVFVAPPELGSAGKLRVGFLDVGQGDAAVIRFPDGRHVVIDAGPRAGGYDSGARIVVPFLKRQDVDTVDLLMISHPHDDHFGGAPALYAHLAVRKTLESGQPVASPVYSRYVTAVRSEGSPVDTGRAGTLVAEFGAARLYVLAPENEFIDPDTSNRHPNINNTSVVVKVQYGAISFLFAGDAEEEAESRLVDRYGDFLRSDILKTGHHGSRTSSTPEFLAAVEPRHAVVSVGRFNRFRHPSPLVLARLEAMGAEIHRTDRDGAIFFETDGRTVERVAWR
jgi:competence protein ComEC